MFTPSKLLAVVAVSVFALATSGCAFYVEDPGVYYAPAYVPPPRTVIVQEYYPPPYIVEVRPAPVYHYRWAPPPVYRPAPAWHSPPYRGHRR